MKYLWLISFTMIPAFIFMAAGCNDRSDAETQVETDQVESPITYGHNRDVEQARGQWRHAEQASLLHQDQLLQSALATRGTAYIRGDLYQYPNCTERGPGRGSGFLTSSKALVAARHVVEPIQSSRSSIVAYFESAFSFDDTGSEVSEFGRFTADGYENPIGEPLSPFDRVYGASQDFTDHQTKFAGNEENPLLANRLASLGLENLDE